MIVNLKDTFNNVVTMYDAARPTYPLELLNDIKDFAEKSFFTRGLEIGAGRDNIDNGFILAYGGIEENCTIRAMFDAKRDELSDIVHRLLFV